MKRIGYMALVVLWCMGYGQARSEQLHRELGGDAFHITAVTASKGRPTSDGPLLEDRGATKTVPYTDVDAVNRAINAVALSSVTSAMHGTKGKPWMRRTTLSLQLEQDWKPLYAIETVQPVGHYDDVSRSVWFTQQRVSRAADVGTTYNVGIGYRRISDDQRHLYGANVFYDRRFLGRHGRMSVGLEYISGDSQFHFHWYGAATKERMIDGETHLMERVTNGYTISYGRTFRNARWARIYLEGYRWSQVHQADKHGLVMGADMQITPRLSLDIGYHKPEHQSGSPYGKITFRLAGNPIAYYGGQHSVDHTTSVRVNMLDLVRRHHTVWVE